jgi:hypothetical protein
MSYIERAKSRASRRKSPWNLLLLAAFLGAFLVLLVASISMVELLHAGLYPSQSLRYAQGVGVIVATCAPIIGALPLSMLVGNTVVWLIPDARHALDLEAGSSKQLQFSSAQRQLITMTKVLVPVAALACLIGIVVPW